MKYHLILLSLLILTSCNLRPKATPSVQIQDAVATTLASIPTNAPRPTATIFPTATPFDLKGLFCEYQFCIGHPLEMSFYDVSAVTSNQATPSSYQTGLMAAYSANLLITLTWQLSPGTADPQFLLELILDDGVDTRVGTQEVKLVRDMNVIYTPISTTATTILPYGGAAAWTCGDRVFAWKIYAPDEASAPALFESALDRFTCNR